MAKTEIIERLGDREVLLPGLIAEALAANDRAKVRLALLQAAAAHAAAPDQPAAILALERGAAGLSAPEFDHVVADAEALDASRFCAPGARALLDGLKADLASLLAPLVAADAAQASALQGRLAALEASMPAATHDVLEQADVGSMARARRDGPDSVHLLVMDLHRELNQLAAATAVETIDGAKAHSLTPSSRLRLAAFMRGLNRTAPLAFGHPGLGTTAAQLGERLTIQNDIGETDAHVLVAHVEGLVVTVTYTDVHRRRARFFTDLLGDEVAWSALAEQSAHGLNNDEAFYLVTGRCEAKDEAALLAFLERLGGRVVFLIDWNKARKALRTFVDRDAAVGLLRWAADAGLGHRAFLVLGGASLVFDSIRRAAADRIPYGARLDEALGAAETQGFLRRVLKETSQGLAAGRSARLIRDEIQADLAQRFETAESTLYAILVRNVGLARMLAADIAERLGRSGAPGEAWDLAARAKRLEAKGDRLTLQARELCGRLADGGGARRLTDAVEDAMDALDEGAFLLSLAPDAPRAEATLARLAEIVVEAASQMARALEAAVHAPEGGRDDAALALQAIDAVAKAERDADEAERAAIGALMAQAQPDVRGLVRGIEAARALEMSTDHLAHAALALRLRLLEELSA